MSAYSTNPDVFAAIILAIFGGPAYAAAADEDLQRIVESQSQVHSLQARFVQTKTLSLFDDPILASGTIVIKKPDVYCWVYQEPEQSIFYVDGMRTGSYQPETGERDEVDLDGRIGLAAIIRSVTSIISGHLDSTAEAEYEILRNPSSDELMSYSFRPRHEELRSLFDQVTIRFDKQTHLARDLEIAEHNGDVTEMAFDRWQVNVPVKCAGLVE